MYALSLLISYGAICMKRYGYFLILTALLIGIAFLRNELARNRFDTAKAQSVYQPSVRSPEIIPNAYPLPLPDVFFPVVAKDICYTDTTRFEMSTVPAAIQAGDTVTVTATLINTGCAPVGLPKYTLTLGASSSGAVLSPAEPEPVIHYLGISPQGGVDQAEFLLQATGPGEAILTCTVSFEVHLGYPGPAYWGGNAAKPLKITVFP
jgi:hypothetical protein